jgi:hypothetical protein
MQEKSEEQIISRLLELENSGQAERRVELDGLSFISLIHDPDSGRGFVLKHGVDETEGAQIPEGTEFWEYPTPQEAEQAFEQLVNEAAREGAVVEDDATDDIGDFETGGADVRDMYSDSDSDSLINPEGGGDPIIQRDDSIGDEEENLPNPEA